MTTRETMQAGLDAAHQNKIDFETRLGEIQDIEAWGSFIISGTDLEMMRNGYVRELDETKLAIKELTQWLKDHDDQPELPLDDA